MSDELAPAWASRECYVCGVMARADAAAASSQIILQLSCKRRKCPTPQLSRESRRAAQRAAASTTP